MKVYSSSNQGLFGSSLFWLLNRLPYFFEKKLYPSWEIKNINHGDPVKKDNIVPGIISPKRVDDLPKKRLNLDTIPAYNFTDFKEANFYFNHYFEFNKDIIGLSKQISKDFKNTLGIHFRGYDKTTNNHEAICINKNKFLKKIKEYIKNNKFDSIFILSDQLSLKEFLKEELGNLTDCKILYSDLAPTFHLEQQKLHNKLKLTKSSVAEMLALSKCNHVLKSHSAFSSWAKIINPDLEMYRVNECKNNWFPDYYLPEF
jgi:hypothetical protein